MIVKSFNKEKEEINTKNIVLQNEYVYKLIKSIYKRG